MAEMTLPNGIRVKGDMRKLLRMMEEEKARHPEMARTIAEEEELIIHLLVA